MKGKCSFILTYEGDLSDLMSILSFRRAAAESVSTSIFSRREAAIPEVLGSQAFTKKESEDQKKLIYIPSFLIH